MNSLGNCRVESLEPRNRSRFDALLDDKLHRTFAQQGSELVLENVRGSVGRWEIAPWPSANASSGR